MTPFLSYDLAAYLFVLVVCVFLLPGLLGVVQLFWYFFGSRRAVVYVLCRLPCFWSWSSVCRLECLACVLDECFDGLTLSVAYWPTYFTR